MPCFRFIRFNEPDLQLLDHNRLLIEQSIRVLILVFAVARVAVAPGVVQDALGVVAAQVKAQLGAPNVRSLAIQEDLAPIGRGIGAKAPLAQLAKWLVVLFKERLDSLPSRRV